MCLYRIGGSCRRRCHDAIDAAARRANGRRSSTTQTFPIHSCCCRRCLCLSFVSRTINQGILLLFRRLRVSFLSRRFKVPNVRFNVAKTLRELIPLVGDAGIQVISQKSASNQSFCEFSLTALFVVCDIVCLRALSLWNEGHQALSCDATLRSRSISPYFYFGRFARVVIVFPPSDSMFPSLLSFADRDVQNHAELGLAALNH
jgi:hypothetical protein